MNKGYKITCVNCGAEIVVKNIENMSFYLPNTDDKVSISADYDYTSIKCSVCDNEEVLI